MEDVLTGFQGTPEEHVWHAYMDIRSLVDERGRPVPFYLTGYETYGTGREANSGYYIRTLYQRGPCWYRAGGRHGITRFPLCAKWAIIPRTRPKPVQLSPQVEALVFDYGNDPHSRIHTTLSISNTGELRTGPRDIVVNRDVEDYIGPTSVSAVFTGVNRWPDRDSCDFSTTWISEPNYRFSGTR